MKVYAWQGPGLFEVAFVELEDDRLSARGTQLAAGHRLSYVLHTGSTFVSERLSAEVETEHGVRTLDLRRGTSPLKGDVLDVDVAGSPLFNSLPVVRDRLHEGGEAHAYAMAYVRVPELAAERAAQRYVPLDRGVVRYRDAAFTADIEFDADGFVVRYPGLAERVSSQALMAYEFKLPDLGEGLTEGEIARWLVSEGQEIAEDDPLVEIQTDKTTVEVPSPAAGLVSRILVEEGEVVPVGTVLVVIGADGADAPAVPGLCPRRRRSQLVAQCHKVFRARRSRAGDAARATDREGARRRSGFVERNGPGRADHRGGRAGRRR